MPVMLEIDSQQLLQGHAVTVPVANGEWYVQPLSLPASDDRPLSLVIISVEPVPQEAPQPGEGVEALIARITRTYRYPQALVLLVNPEQALGPEHMAHAQGCGLIAITSPERELCWDAALSKGLPCYGVRDTLRLECTQSTAQAALSALAFGLFVCHTGWTEVEVSESRQGVSWRSLGGSDIQASVLIRDGFEVASFQGSEGSWRDRGDEGMVRLQLSHGDHRLWTQPRFIMPSAGPMPGAPSGIVG